MKTLLKLRARDAEDIQVISAMLQDAIVPLCDMAFQPERHSFILVAQRLRREAGKADERVCCAVTISGVVAAQTHGIDQNNPTRMLDLLAVMLDASQSQLSLIFAGDASIRLCLDGWQALAEDFGEAWPALSAPCHDSAS